MNPTLFIISSLTEMMSPSQRHTPKSIPSHQSRTQYISSSTQTIEEWPNRWDITTPIWSSGAWNYLYLFTALIMAYDIFDQFCFGAEFLSWGCFRKWKRKEKGGSRSVRRCDRLENHTKHRELGGAAASFSFSVKGGKSIAQSMTGLLTAGGQEGSAARKVQISGLWSREAGKTHTFSSLAKYLFLRLKSTNCCKSM